MKARRIILFFSVLGRGAHAKANVRVISRKGNVIPPLFICSGLSYKGQYEACGELRSVATFQLSNLLFANHNNDHINHLEFAQKLYCVCVRACVCVRTCVPASRA